MYLVGAVGELVLKYFYRHLALYLALFLLFSIGVGFGALAPQKLSPPQRADLSGFLSNIYTSAAQNDSAVIGRSEILYQSILDNVLKTAALLFVLGLTVIGAPLVLGIVFLRGFVLGFTVGFLIQETSLNGLILAAAAVLPHNVVAVPAIMIAAGGALAFASTAFQTMCGLSQRRIYGQLLSSGFICICSCLLLTVAALIETYLTPVLIGLTSGFLL
ncbi:MAG TPA: stage II sporulation protein M [Firmicutes bacterium]|nr:stage II sporulation protein M [Bacillota bacterium]